MGNAGNTNTSWELDKDASRLMPFRVIAEKLGCSERSVSTYYNAAVRKLKKQPDAFLELLNIIHATRRDESTTLKAGSLECWQEWIALNHE